MATKAPIVMGREIRDRLEQLHKLYGREQPLLDVLDGLIARLGHARQLYGPGRSLPGIVNGIYAQLDELRQLYDCESIEEILAGIIARKKRLNRLVELQSKAPVTDDENHEIEYLIKQYLYELGREQAHRKENGNGKAKRGRGTPQRPQDHDIRSKNGISKSGLHP
jgi:hypothetical protein